MSRHQTVARSIFIAVLLAAGPAALVTLAPSVAAQPITAEQRDAFNTAKELGTVAAWNAYLKSYPTGFYADLARAYISKIESVGTTVKGSGDDQPPRRNVADTQAGTSAAAERVTCKAGGKLKSKSSSRAARVTFENRSGMYRSLQWINGKGEIKDIGGLNSGESITVDTFETHPWRISNGPGDCLEIFLPAAGTSTIVLERLPADDP